MGRTGPKPLIEPRESLIGMVFGSLTVIGYHGRNSSGRWSWICSCNCGGQKPMDANHLKTGNTKTCGNCVSNTLQRLEIKYGRSVRYEYKKWQSAQDRCKPHFKGHRDYFDRGVRVCPEWEESFELFLSHIGLSPDGYTLDRINNELGYQPGNVRWVPGHKQASNKRNNNFITYKGETKHAAEWARITGIAQGTISHRLIHGWPVEQALNPHLSYSETVSLGLKLSRERS